MSENKPNICSTFSPQTCDTAPNSPKHGESPRLWDDDLFPAKEKELFYAIEERKKKGLSLAKQFNEQTGR